MAVKLTDASRTELADSLRQCYQSSRGKTKKLILSEFIASTGYLRNPLDVNKRNGGSE